MTTGIGERLREARSARGIELADVEEQTKIRTGYLRALEEERWESLPGAAYVRGFLRTYADFLGLDGDVLVEEYRRASEPQEEQPGVEQVPRIATPERRGLGLPGFAHGGPRPGPGTLTALAALALFAILLVLGLAGGSEEEGGEPAETAAPSEPAESASPEGSAPAEAAVEPPSRVTLRLRPTGTVWVCLVDQGGRPLVEGVTLTAGDEQGPFRARAFEITLGNGQIEMEANGERVPIPSAPEPLGYHLTPEQTRELSPSARPACA